MAGFGSFMEGVSKGARTAIDWSNAIQEKDANDILIRQAKDSETARTRALARRGQKGSSYKTRDPVFKSIAAKLFGGDEEAASVLMPEDDGDMPMDSETFDAAASLGSQVTDPTYDTSLFGGKPPPPPQYEEGAMPQYADGDRISEEELRRQQEARRARTERGNSKPYAEEAARKAKETHNSQPRRAVDPPKPVEAAPAEAGAKPGVVRRAVDFGKKAPGRIARGAGQVAAGAAAYGGAESIVDNVFNPEEHLRGAYRRFGQDPDRAVTDPYWKRAMYGSARHLQDMGNAVIPEGIEKWLNTDPATTEGRVPARAPAAPSAPAAPAPTRTSGPSNPRGRPGGRAIPAGPSSQEAPPPGTERVTDWSQVSDMDIPNMKTQDWEQYRDEAVTDLIYRGMDEMTAMQQVDQQVVSMQMNGFKKMFQMGTARLQMGDERGGLALLKAAFQYMPTTTDVKFGKYNGHILAVGVDEDTGEPVGTPLVVEPENLSKMMANFLQPGVWAEYAQDRRKYRELEIPKAQSEIQNRALLGRASILNAAQPHGGSGVGGLKFSDRAGQQDEIDTYASALAAAVTEDEEEAAQYQQVFTQMMFSGVERFSMTPQQVKYYIEQALKAGPEKFAELQQTLLGQ